MGQPATQTGVLAEAFADVIGTVDERIGENRHYGAGIGPHDEDDQIDALVKAVRDQNLVDATIATAKADSRTVRYPGGRAADLVLEAPEKTEFCEAKLFRFQKANRNPSSRGFSKVFNPYQDRNPRAFVHDVIKLATADIRARKTFLGIYYRPVEGAGAEITSTTIAEAFADAITRWTDYSVTVDTVAPFDDLQHDVHRRGGILTWGLDDQPDQFF